MSDKLLRGTVLDLFCGAGGFSLGSELAGFQSVLGVDIDPQLQSGYKRNFPRTRAVQADLRDLGATEWRGLLSGHRPDGVIGGPPCQGFSTIGRRNADDPRNDLIQTFIRHVNTVYPRFFVMENVEGILLGDNASVIPKALEGLRCEYDVLPPFVVNAADHGAPTSRRRVVLVGYLPSEVDPLALEDFQVTAPPVRVSDAISDLPSPIKQPANKEDLAWARYPKRDPSLLSAYARQARALPPAGLGSEEGRSQLRAGFVSGLAETVHRPDVAERYAALLGGTSDPITKSYRLTWNGLCPTLRAGTGPDKGAFQAVRPLHPQAGRVITVREAARLQGFPDWYLFHPAKWHSFRMIGNSVSPIVSHSILQVIASRIGVALAA